MANGGSGAVVGHAARARTVGAQRVERDVGDPDEEDAPTSPAPAAGREGAAGGGGSGSPGGCSGGQTPGLAGLVGRSRAGRARGRSCAGRGRRRRRPAGRRARAATPARAATAARRARRARAPPAGRASTPSSETARSTTVTKPKSRSMRMSETTSTANPAIAVAPRRRTARAGGAVGAGQRLGDRVAVDPLLAVALRQQHAELGRDRDDQRAQRRPTSGSAAPGWRTAPAPTSRRPARSAPAGTSARSGRRYTASRASDDEQEAAEHGEQAAPGRGDLALASAASTGRPTTWAPHAGRRVESVAHLLDHLLLAVQRHQPDAERHRGQAPVGRDHGLGEVRRARRRAGRGSRARSSRLVGRGTGWAARAPGTAAAWRQPRFSL